MLLVLLHGPAARAASPESVEGVIERGNELRRQKKDDEALALFQKAYALDPSPRTQALLGVAEGAAGKWLESETHLTHALANASESWVQKNRASLERSLDAVREHIGYLLIKGGALGAAVYVQGEPRGSLPLADPVRVLEGAASIQITSPTHQPFQRIVRVRAGEVKTVEVQLEPRETADAHGLPGEALAPRTSAERRGDVPRDESTSRLWKTVGGIALGVAGVGTGIYGGVSLARSKGSCENEGVLMCNEAASSNRVLGWGLLGGGLGAAVVGGVLLYSGQRVRIAATVSPGQQMLVLRGAL
jgi:hypothetical protein